MDNDTIPTSYDDDHGIGDGGSPNQRRGTRHNDVDDTSIFDDSTLASESSFSVKSTADTAHLRLSKGQHKNDRAFSGYSVDMLYGNKAQRRSMDPDPSNSNSDEEESRIANDDNEDIVFPAGILS